MIIFLDIKKWGVAMSPQAPECNNSFN